MFPALIPLISGIGALAGKIMGGRGAGRAEEAKIGLQADQLALQRAGQAKEFEGTNARRMLSSDILAHLQPTKMARPSTWPEMTGGSGGGIEAMSPEARQAFMQSAGAYRGSMPGAEIPTPDFGTRLGGKIAAKNYAKQNPNGQRVGVAGVPTATTMPKPGMADSILSILSGVGQFGGLMGGQGGGTAAPTPGMSNPQFRPPPGVRF